MTVKHFDIHDVCKICTRKFFKMKALLNFITEKNTEKMPFIVDNSSSSPIL